MLSPLDGEVKFRPPTPFTFSSYEDSSYSKIDLPLYSIFASLLWGMENTYGTSKGPCQYSRAMGTVKLDDFIREFETCCDMH
jgi:hypothetical protein